MIYYILHDLFLYFSHDRYIFPYLISNNYMEKLPSLKFRLLLKIFDIIHLDRYYFKSIILICTYMYMYKGDIQTDKFISILIHICMYIRVFRWRGRPFK